MPKNILIIDDERDICEIITDILHDEGYKSSYALNSEQAFDAISRNIPDALILDIWLKGSNLDGIGILEIIKKKYPHIPVIIMSGHGNIETAVSALRRGAYDYIEKPFHHEKLLQTLANALKLLETTDDVATFNDLAFIGNSKAVTDFNNSLAQIAKQNSRVLINTQAGVSSYDVAYRIHQLSNRNEKDFLTLFTATSDNHAQILCGTADDKKIYGKPRIIGLFERGDGGTLFIDEIANLDKSGQKKLLHLLQHNNFTRISGKTERNVDIRVIASSIFTIDDLRDKIDSQIIERISLVQITPPDLEQRYDDFDILIKEISGKKASDYNISPINISEDIISNIKSHKFTYNIAELENIIDWLYLSGNSELPPHFVQKSSNYSNSDNIKQARDIFEKEYIVMHLRKFSGNMSQTAKEIGMERTAFHRKVKELGIK